MGGVVAAALTCEHQRRQQDLVYTEADDQHLKASSFTIFAPPGLRHILLPALPIRPVTEPLGSKSKARRSVPSPIRRAWAFGTQTRGVVWCAIRISMGGDDEQVIVSSALTVAAAIGADVKLLDDMAHALAEEPGHRAAPQTEVAKRVDPIAAEWLREHLTWLAPLTARRLVRVVGLELSAGARFRPRLPPSTLTAVRRR